MKTQVNEPQGQEGGLAAAQGALSSTLAKNQASNPTPAFSAARDQHSS